MIIYEKIDNFMQKTGKSFSAKTLSRRLNLNWETTRKYLRFLHYDGQLKRVWIKDNSQSCYRYKAY